MFITFEGPDGSGKSTQIKLFKEHLENKGFDVLLTREPGGTNIGNKIREIILDKENIEMSPITEMFLYAASRAQHVEEVIKPALEENKVVICDRFLDSSIVYQGYARGLGNQVEEVNKFAVTNTLPDYTILLMPGETEANNRVSDRGEKDRLELEKDDFRKKVYEGYKIIAENNPERIILIEGNLTIEETFRRILEKINM